MGFCPCCRSIRHVMVASTVQKGAVKRAEYSFPSRSPSGTGYSPMYMDSPRRTARKRSGRSGVATVRRYSVPWLPSPSLLRLTSQSPELFDHVHGPSWSRSHRAEAFPLPAFWSSPASPSMPGPKTATAISPRINPVKAIARNITASRTNLAGIMEFSPAQAKVSKLAPVMRKYCAFNSTHSDHRTRPCSRIFPLST